MAHMSTGQYSREQGNRVLHKDYVMTPTKVVAKDPCPLGSPETWTVAQDRLKPF